MNVVGLGTHIVECLRIAQLIQRHQDLFLTRIYTTREIEYCSARNAATQHYAACWAAKEAILKALGTGWSRGIQWTDIEVLRGEGGGGAVAAVLAGSALEIARELGIDEILVSLSHCRTHATAFALAVRHEATAEDE